MLGGDIMQNSVGIIGYGAWGKAFGNVLQNSGKDIIFWDRKVHGTHIMDSINGCEYIVLSVPTQGIADVLENNPSFLAKEQKIIILSKGIEEKTLLLPHQIIKQSRGNDIAIGIVSGPNFADEIFKHLPARSTIATENKAISEFLLSLNSYIKWDYSDDLIGVGLCGAIKNVIAIGCGIIYGAYQSYNMQVAFIMNAIDELKKIINACGGCQETVYTAAGIGDIILTATTMRSRNYSFGIKIGAKSLEIQEDMTIEGIKTSYALKKLISLHKIKCDALTTIIQIIESNEFNMEDIKNLCL